MSRIPILSFPGTIVNSLTFPQRSHISGDSEVSQPQHLLPVPTCVLRAPLRDLHGTQLSRSHPPFLGIRAVLMDVHNLHPLSQELGASVLALLEDRGLSAQSGGGAQVVWGGVPFHTQAPVGRSESMLRGLGGELAHTQREPYHRRFDSAVMCRAQQCCKA
jgi:hypothetical protein